MEEGVGQACGRGGGAGRGAGERDGRAADHRGVGGAHAQRRRLRPDWRVRRELSKLYVMLELKTSFEYYFFLCFILFPLCLVFFRKTKCGCCVF